MPYPLILNTERPLQPSELPAFTEQYAIVIPPEYARFLLAHNGGSPQPENFTVLLEPRPHSGRAVARPFGTAVEFFLSLDAPEMSLLSEWHFVTEGRVQAGMFPMAYCGGDLLCLSTRPDTRGQVYYWLHEEEYDGRALTDRNLYYVAGSLDELLGLLRE